MNTINKIIVLSSFILMTAPIQAASKLPPLPIKEMQAFKANHDKVQAALKTATPAQADKLLVQHGKDTNILLRKVDNADNAFVYGQMREHVTLNQAEKVVRQSAALKAREKELAKYHLRYEFYPPSDVGMVVLEKDYYTKLFNGKVSPTAQAFLDLHQEQGKESPYYDQEMVMAYEDVGKRLIAWERYLNKYGNNHALIHHAKCQYVLYQQLFLTGGYFHEWGLSGISDNPNITNAKLKQEVKWAWADYQQKYPQSATSALIAKMPKKPPYPNAAEKIIADYQKRTGLNFYNPQRCERWIL